MKQFFSPAWALLLLSLTALAHAASSAGDRLLVITDDATGDRETYGRFFGDLEGRGFQISYESPKNEGLKLFNLGERVFDHLLMLPTRGKGLGPNLTPAILLDFLNSDGNLLITLSSTHTVPSSLVSLLLELDIQLPSDRTATVVDHFSYDTISAPDLHDVLVLSPASPIRSDIKDLFSTSSASDVLAFPHGVPQTLGSSALLAPVLRAPRTAYSYNPREQTDGIDGADELFAVGEQMSLISTIQARNSARLTVLGSAEMLSDVWTADDAVVLKHGGSKADKKAVVNREFAKRVAGWTFKEIGVLRVDEIEHHLNEPTNPAGNESNPGIYRVKNDVTYSISLSEYVWDKWTPFVLPETDALQLEFSMLSPFHRIPLLPTESSSPSTATYTTSFTLPDQHGIFNFKVNYKRPFLSNVDEKVTVSVRHMAHDEWPRSYVITGAWPWIAGIGATVGGWVVFCGIWMYSAPPKDVGSKKRQ